MFVYIKKKTYYLCSKTTCLKIFRKKYFSLFNIIKKGSRNSVGRHYEKNTITYLFTAKNIQIF